MEFFDYSLSNDFYSILFRKDGFFSFAAYIAKEFLAANYVIISDSNVATILAVPFLHELRKCTQAKVHIVSFMAGEKFKTRETKEMIEDTMLEKMCNRDTVIIAIGGGVVGDMAGFVASTFCRGVKFVQVPTSLLAMVDSSVGGKVAVDTIHGKNMIGAFYSPVAVLIDISVLNSLPKRELINGMAEVIKIAAIYCKKFFEFLEINMTKLLHFDDCLVECVQTAVALKLDVCNQDPKELGIRSILNFGHTIGHALEIASNGKLLHGEAVAIGMLMESELAFKKGLKLSCYNRLFKLLQVANLPTSNPDICFFDYLKHDKKCIDGKIRCIFMKEIGSFFSNGSSFSFNVDYGNLDSLKTIQVFVPGSKSVTNRALLIAALGEGVCKLTGVLEADDTIVMKQSLAKLGINIEAISDDSLVVHGCSGKLGFPVATNVELFVGNAGTAARFLTSASILFNGEVTLSGDDRMNQRPIGDLVKSLREAGVKIDELGDSDCTPLRVHGQGVFGGGAITLCSNTSSQYASSVMLISPFASRPVSLEVGTVSESYIEMTASMLRNMGVDIKKNGNIYNIPNSIYRNPEEYAIEGDASSAAFIFSMAAITGKTIKVMNVGANSLQGDSNFVTFLKEIGCDVFQDTNTSTVTGPSQLSAFKKNFAELTDCFLVASVLAAFCNGTSKIFGISNQRVKECNRISAMVSNLQICGIHAKELPDGLEIDGNPFRLLAHDSKVSIPCYGDHRIAMAFSVMAIRCPWIEIADKMCVRKTYPDWWGVSESILNRWNWKNDNPTKPLFLQQVISNGNFIDEELFLESFQSIYIIGMRGVGKSTLARSICKVSSLKIVDLDSQFEICFGDISNFVKMNGWEKFRAIESELLLNSYRDYPSGCLIVTGGGVVESEVNRLFLRGRKTIWLQRPVELIIKSLNFSHRPCLGEEIGVTYKRRVSFYEQSSIYQFDLSENWNESVYEFMRLITSIVKNPSFSLDEDSYFICLTGDSTNSVENFDFSAITRGVDSIEIRMDSFIRNCCMKMKCTNPVTILGSLGEMKIISSAIISLTRRRSSLPIIFTVRTLSQGGFFKLECFSSGILSELYLHAACLGVSIIDIECCHPDSTFWISHLKKNYPNVVVIASMHHLNAPLTSEIVESLCKCNTELSDILKIVTTASCNGDILSLSSAVIEFRRNMETNGLKLKPKPIISLCMGAAGSVSRIYNITLSPVTHPRLPFPAAPGQLSLKQILESKLTLKNLTCPKHISQLNELFGGLIFNINYKIYFLVGSSVSKSPSPFFHNTGFEFLGSNSVYIRLDLSDFSGLSALIESLGTNFGGASITIPFKESILTLKNVVYSPAVKIIGSANTLFLKKGVIFGDNTDWIGLYATICINPTIKYEIAIIFGAGGTSRAAVYALKKLKFKRIIVINRNSKRAKEVASALGCDFIESIEEFEASNIIPSLMINTLPSSANFSLSDSLLLTFPENFCSFIDVNYADTEFLIKCKPYGSSINGKSMFMYQGIAQFHLWSERTCADEVMFNALEHHFQRSSI